jgi:DNA polymerase-3 subunit beta
MQFDCPRKEFADAVTMAVAASSVRTSLPILQTLKIEATDAGIRVVGCDGEMWVERSVACMTTEPGAICLPARTLNDIVSSLGEGDIHLKTQDEGGALLTQANSEYRLQSMEATDFPEPPAFGGDGELVLDMGELRDAVDSVIYAVSTDPHRQILTGVLFNYNGSKLTLVATDTHRLAVRSIDKEGIGSNVSAVVPERALRSIKALPLADDKPVEIKFGGGRLGVEVGGAKVVSQLLNGAFPNWERVVPSETTRTWKIESDELLEKVKRALILARDNANRLRFKGDGEEVVISGKSEERGEAKESVAMVGSNGDIEIAFNGKYVQEAVSAIGGQGAKIEMTENTRAAVFRSAEKDDYFCVIMPMQLT